MGKGRSVRDIIGKEVLRVDSVEYFSQGSEVSFKF